MKLIAIKLIQSNLKHFQFVEIGARGILRSRHGPAATQNNYLLGQDSMSSFVSISMNACGNNLRLICQ